MRNRILLVAGLMAAAWASYSVARTQPSREPTEPPGAPPQSGFDETVAAVGLVESSTENISMAPPLGGVVTRVFVAAGQSVRARDPLFELDTRHVHAELVVRQRTLGVARARLTAAEARAADVVRQLEFAEGVRDKRAISAEELARRRSAVETATAEVAQARSEVAAAESQIQAVKVDLDRSVVRAPLDADVLQVKVRPGEYAPAALTGTPLVLLGRPRPLHVRVDIDEHEGWRIQEGAAAVGHVRGNAMLETPLRFVRIEPLVVPKRSLTGDGTERVDTRVLQVIYRIERDDLPVFVGQQLDVFIDGAHRAGGAG